MNNAQLATIAVGLAPSLIAGITKSFQANKAKRKMQEAEDQMKYLLDNRQDIPNPADNFQDLSGMISNPYANLSVATKAAEMQAEEADISLANTLDTLRQSGMGAGGATALAQAAAKSKAGVSASIETQEANNEKLRAQGQAAADQAMMAEKQRMQQVDASAEQWMFGQEAAREDEQIGWNERQADKAWYERHMYRDEAKPHWNQVGSTAGAVGMSAMGNAMGITPGGMGDLADFF